MSGRDHSIECETCGVYCGGLNDSPCDCTAKSEAKWTCPTVEETMMRYAKVFEALTLSENLERLAHNLAVAGALCRAFDLGCDFGAWTEDPYPDPLPWQPGCGDGCGRSAP